MSRRSRAISNAVSGGLIKPLKSRSHFTAPTVLTDRQTDRQTIGGDSDADGSDRPRQKKIRRRSRPGRCKERRKQLTRRDDGNGDDGD